MISVCIITYNGEKFIKAQIQSIISQLGDNDEVVISDDGSSDSTLDIISAFNDCRIKVYHNPAKSGGFRDTMEICFRVGRNAENALKHANGDYIFLADQDDIWLPNKVTECVKALEKYDLVITNHIPVDETLQKMDMSINLEPIKTPTLINTLIRTPFLGCCMAFSKNLLQYILPFPKQPLMHDIWIGLMALKHGKIGLIQEPYLLYRRHSDNASINIGQKSTNSLGYKLMYRKYLLEAYINN
ncbi:MAG TPA: glycosyltransferase family 2 protein [Muribaculum sp.]|jgi:glycosyltransferase involved in cell wall biosynthesis|uniref:Glycosyltransferase family 2 protein n=1 Tax=Heminiphilus faecis TaxID=2601703 RepID=A0ABV4CZ06_9BACT|nr:glycosyltransferase family 2 protein [Heminiphilus faecis]RLT77718.1 glycosyltransferase family 2 protein [bacterium J10(2018)]HRF69149.1 glycosyltransferase family 2 protein [Muribaculum sp.]